MIQDIAPHKYHNEFCKRPAENEDYILLFQNGKAVLQVENEIPVHPKIKDIPGITPSDCRSLFQIDDEWYAMEKDDYTGPLPEGYQLLSAGQYRKLCAGKNLFALAVAGSLNRWYHDNRYCGACGAENQDSAIERALVCPHCGKTIYPKICPAVIVAVRDGDRLLLTKYANRPITNYALIAGFAEIGESIEETVHREVLEETGVKVKNLQFYKSQPWVFTDTLLMGFFCDLDGSDHITLQESELAVGEWVHREDVPADTSHISLTAEMIDLFRRGLR